MNFFKPKFWDKTEISFFSIMLSPVTLIIKILAFLKRTLATSYKCSIPIICVGNIYLGGTGKTPMSIEIYKILKNLNLKPAFIRKKYKSFQDEANLQKKIGLTFQNKNRLMAINEAVQSKANIAILDDGFQDFSMEKNLSIVCFNEKQWIGNGLTIPSGPLREELSSLRRADCVVINGRKNLNIENKIFNKNKEIKIFYTKYVPQNINEFKNKKIIAFAGIGNPENFFDLLKDSNINLLEKFKFSDHHKYAEKELVNLFNIAQKNNATLLTTEKDYFRINEDYKKNISFLKIEVEIKNRDEFINLIRKSI